MGRRDVTRDCLAILRITDGFLVLIPKLYRIGYRAFLICQMARLINCVEKIFDARWHK